MKKFRILIIISIVIFIFVLSSLIGWNILKSPINSKNNKEIEVVIPKGAGISNIAIILKDKNLIRNSDFFKLYTKIKKINNLKATTYKLKQNMTMDEIIKALEDGNNYNPDEIVITINEGINMRDIARIISSKTNNSYDDVINKSNDIDYINRLKEKYWFITDEVYNNKLYYKLEGYLYPDTYILRNKYVDVEYIFDKMIDEMSKYLDKYRDYNYNKLSLHQRLSLASMVEKETLIKKDRTKMASVFLNRMKKNMNLGSDVTAKYANKIDEKRALTIKEFNLNSPYNTRLNNGSMNGKLPIGPISTISKSSIDASFNPDKSDYLYFISNIETFETYFFDDYKGFLKKKEELKEVNKGY